MVVVYLVNGSKALTMFLAALILLSTQVKEAHFLHTLPPW